MEKTGSMLRSSDTERRDVSFPVFWNCSLRRNMFVLLSVSTQKYLDNKSRLSATPYKPKALLSTLLDPPDSSRKTAHWAWYKWGHTLPPRKPSLGELEKWSLASCGWFLPPISPQSRTLHAGLLISLVHVCRHHRHRKAEDQ